MASKIIVHVITDETWPGDHNFNGFPSYNPSMLCRSIITVYAHVSILGFLWELSVGCICFVNVFNYESICIDLVLCSWIILYWCFVCLLLLFFCTVYELFIYAVFSHCRESVMSLLFTVHFNILVTRILTYQWLFNAFQVMQVYTLTTPEWILSAQKTTRTTTIWSGVDCQCFEKLKNKGKKTQPF